MRYTFLVLGVAALALPACAGKHATSTDRAANTAAAKKAKPKYVTMDEMYDRQDDLMKGRGVFSGEKGYLTIYSKEGPGSSDPNKPVKVPRQKR